MAFVANGPEASLKFSSVPKKEKLFAKKVHCMASTVDFLSLRHHRLFQLLSEYPFKYKNIPLI